MYVRITSVSRWSVTGEILDPQPLAENLPVDIPSTQIRPVGSEKRLVGAPPAEVGPVDSPPVRQAGARQPMETQPMETQRIEKQTGEKQPVDSQPVGKILGASTTVETEEDREGGSYEGIRGQNSAVVRGLEVSGEGCACGSAGPCCSVGDREGLLENDGCGYGDSQVRERQADERGAIGEDEKDREIDGVVEAESVSHLEAEARREAEAERVSKSRLSQKSGVGPGAPFLGSAIDILLVGGIAIGTAGLVATGYLWTYS